MIENQDILYSVAGQSLEFDAPEGIPTSITSTVFENSDGDDSTAESATTGSAAASTVATTFDAVSGSSEANPNLLNVTATAGFVRLGRYLATNSDSEPELIEVVAVESGVRLQSRHELKNDYAIGDDLVATRITHALDTTWVSDKNNISQPDPSPRYRWRLEYTVAGKIYVHNAFFDLVRESGNTTVSPLDIDSAYPLLQWLTVLPTNHREDRGAGIIKDAYRQVKLAMSHEGKADEAARNREMMEDLVIHKAALMVAGDSFETFEQIKLNYDTAFNNFIRGGVLKMDSDGSGAAKPSPKSRVWRR